MKTEIILNTSDEAAKYISGLSGWVSRTGRFWADDERMARYEGCTHTVCECGNPVEKGWIKCEDCRRKIEDEKFLSLKKQEWDETVPVTLYEGDEYFFDYESLENWCEENEVNIHEVRLLICQPNYAREINEDYYCDDLPEDQSLEDVVPALAEYIEGINAFIREAKPILSWSPSNVVAIIKKEENTND